MNKGHPMRFRTAFLATALLCTASATAMAQQTSGFYLGIGGGANWARDADVSGAGLDTDAKYDTGWAALGTAGYGFGNGLRLELELGYRDNDIDKVNGVAGAGGSTNVWSGMVNALYDINV